MQIRIDRWIELVSQCYHRRDRDASTGPLVLKREDPVLGHDRQGRVNTWMISDTLPFRGNRRFSALHASGMCVILCMPRLGFRSRSVSRSRGSSCTAALGSPQPYYLLLVECPCVATVDKIPCRCKYNDVCI
jgi:hypothetical protein